MEIGVKLVSALLQFYAWLIIIDCIASWIPVEKGLFAEIRDVLDTICNPYLSLFRKIVPSFGSLDFSPWIAVIALQLVAANITRLL